MMLQFYALDVINIISSSHRPFVAFIPGVIRAFIRISLKPNLLLPNSSFLPVLIVVAVSRLSDPDKYLSQHSFLS